MWNRGKPGQLLHYVDISLAILKWSVFFWGLFFVQPEKHYIVASNDIWFKRGFFSTTMFVVQHKCVTKVYIVYLQCTIDDNQCDITMTFGLLQLLSQSLFLGKRKSLSWTCMQTKNFIVHWLWVGKTLWWNKVCQLDSERKWYDVHFSVSFYV